ncbi:hypothetical protein FA95DRAFT_301689 [Auriscalpium vulgare]|uniref:Uncharacterized protein n=1 Tax=Auriscalpium vulgare TaxID=40419 RepID=A0ACB8RJP8_9AGAM|nr:hypothetical protein FA95DRAFT_301689 [Auriscalpium vulgare]
MELRFSRNSLFNTVLRDTQGAPLFRIDTRKGPRKVSLTTVSRFVGGVDEPSREVLADGTSRNVTGDGASDTDILLMGLQEEQVAQIEWHYWSQSIFRIRGETKEVKEYMPGKGVLRRQRIFTASNGQKYKWQFGCNTCWLQLDDGKDTVVARFHRSSRGFVGKAHNAYLEVVQEIMPIIDEVIMTFIWVEKRREDRQKAWQHRVYITP